MTDTHRGDRDRPSAEDVDAGTSKDHEDDDGPISSVRQRYEKWRESIARRPNVERAYRIGVGVLGGAIVIGGLALVPLPGPGWVIVFVGLAILATEFVWAERIEKFAKKQVSTWTKWLGRQSIAVRALVGLATFAFVAAVLYVVLRLTGVPGWVPDVLWDWIPGLK